MKLSAYISYFYDFDMLLMCLDRINGLFDEIIIADGPFEYILDDLQKLNIDSWMTEQQQQYIQQKYTNITYIQNVWPDEFKKRISTYEQCKNDLILMIDTDEMIDFKPEDFEDIAKNNFGSASVNFLNLCQLGYCFDKTKQARKNILFNRKLVSGEDHLDYMWIAGYTKKATTQKIKRNCNSQVYHYSLYRPLRPLMVKYLFYSTLWYKIKELPHQSLLNQFKNVAPETMQNMLNRSGITHLGFPHDQMIYNTWFTNSILEEQKQEFSKTIQNLPLQINDNVCHGYSMYGLVPVNQGIKQVTITLEKSVDRIHTDICPILLEANERPKNIFKESLSADSITLDIPANTFANAIRLAYDDKNIINNKITDIKYNYE